MALLVERDSETTVRVSLELYYTAAEAVAAAMAAGCEVGATVATALRATKATITANTTAAQSQTLVTAATQAPGESLHWPTYVGRKMS